MRRLAAIVALLVAAAVVAELTHGAPRLAGSNDLDPQHFLIAAAPGQEVCQGQETLYAGTASLRVTAVTDGASGLPLELDVRSGARVLASGSLAAGWRGGEVAIPIAPVPDTTVEGVTVCVRGEGALRLAGEAHAGATVAGTPVPARFSLHAYRAGEPSLLGSLGLIAERYAHAAPSWLGEWTLVLIALLAFGAVAAAAAALRAPSARLCALAFVLGGLAWALLTPTWHVPDEVAHVAYVQSVAERGALPRDDPASDYSPEANALLAGADFWDVIGSKRAKPAWTPSEEHVLREAEATTGSQAATDATVANNNPPLYYLAQAPVEVAASSAELPNRMLLMRALSVLLGALTVAFTFAFLRELLPGRPRLWALGALAVALQPLFGFAAAGVNPDALLFAAGAATFWAMALVLRRGLTPRSAAILGAAVATGMLTKPLFLALVPAALAALALAAWRGRAWRALAVGLAIALLPVVAYDAGGRLIGDRSYAGPIATAVDTGAATAAGADEGLAARVNYGWQLFLPRLPFMNDRFPGVLHLRTTWFDGFVGRFGWLDYSFGPDATGWALGVAWVLLVLFVVGLWRSRAAVRRRWPELACFALAAGGVCAAIASQQYKTELGGGAAFTQARYLLPLLALYGAFVAIAVGGAGRRFATPVAIVALGVLALHQASALILTLERYYA